MGIDGIGSAQRVPQGRTSFGPDDVGEGEVPEPTPFKASGGQVALTVGSGLGGAAVGAAVGGIALSLLNWRTGGGGSFDKTYMAGAAIGAVVGGAWGAGAYYTGKSDAHREAEQARIDAEFGTPIGMLSGSMIGDFDHDGNGRIDLVNRTGLTGQDERVRLESRVETEGGWHYDWIGDDWDYDSQSVGYSRGISAANVWEAANELDVDGDAEVVEAQELGTLLASFDADESGTLQTAELDAFKEAHPLVYDEWRRGG